MFYSITLIILFGTLSITANLDLQCPQGWHKYDDNCYWFSDFNTTRDNAKLECESWESTLVTVDSKAINTFLKQQITGDLSYWIGLRIDYLAASAWRWNTGGPLNSRITTLHWCDNTSPPYTACAVMYYDHEPCLKSYSCTQLRIFICEKELPKGVTSCPTGWYLYSDSTPRCYYMDEQQKMPRMEAARYCYDIGGRLVTVPSFLTKRYLTNNRPTTDNVHWVGISPYRWDDGTAYNWNDWDANGPHIGDRCTRLLPTVEWTYGSCSSDVYHFVCEKDATIPTATTERSTLAIGSTFSMTHSKASPNKTAKTDDSLFTVGVPVTGFTSTNNRTDTKEVKTKETAEEVTKKYLIIVGIMSAVIACTLGAVVGLVIYIKRKTVPKQHNPASQGVQYEDVSSAYYNVGVDIGKSCDVKIYENKDINSDEQQQTVTYEELTTVSVPKAESGPYAALK